MCLLRLQGQGFRLCAFGALHPLSDQAVQGFLPLLHQSFADVGLGILEIIVQHFLKEAVRLVPVAVLQSHNPPLEQGCDFSTRRRGFHHHPFLHHGLLFQGDILFHIEKNILDRAHFAQIRPLKMLELPGHILRIQILIAGDQVLGFVSGHEFQIPAPFVLYPHGVVVFVAGAHRQHDLGGVQGGEDVRLVGLAQLIPQGDPGEEHPVALLRQSGVEILGQNGVQCPLPLFVGFLVADEDVVGLFRGGYLQNSLPNSFKFLGLLPVDLLRHGVRILTGLLEIAVLHDAVKAGAVAGGNLLSGCRVVYVLDAVFAQHQTPVGLRLLGEVGDDGFIDARRLVEFAPGAKPVGPGKEGQLLFIVRSGHRLPAAAVFAFRNSATRLDHQIPAAHFTFDDGHLQLPLFHSERFPYASARIPGSWSISRCGCAR